MANLRGSKEDVLHGIIEALKIAKTMPDKEIRKAINVIIKFATTQKDKHKR